MTIESQSAFAKRLGVNRSTVTRWKDAERLVMDGGAVDVERSIERIEQTGGGREDVAQRHRLEREQKQLRADVPEGDGGGEASGPQLDPKDVRAQLREAALKKAKADARIKQAEADLKEMDRDQKAGNLISREDVDYVLSDYGALLRVMLDGRAERLGAEQGLTSDQIAAVSEADEQLLLELSDKLKARGVAA